MVLQRAGKRYSVNWSNIKKNTKERGVDDASKLPHYHYRDDGFKIWDAIEAYASQIIGLFYVDDAAVSGDKELQNFSDDLHHNGFPAYGNSSLGHEFPLEEIVLGKFIPSSRLLPLRATLKGVIVSPQLTNSATQD